MIDTTEILERRILIIDDEDANLLLLETLLRREGYSSVHCLSDPSLAIDRLVEIDPHIILLDLMMPDVDGYQLLDAFRRQARPDEFRPVLVLTADTTLQARRRALSLGRRGIVPRQMNQFFINIKISIFII